MPLPSTHRASLNVCCQTPEPSSTPRNGRRGKQAASVAEQDGSDSEEELLESDDSGSEFDPNDDGAESDFGDDLDTDDEELMVGAAVQQSLQSAREDQERTAGLTSAGAASSKARPSPTKAAAALRAAAAERRLARSSQPEVIDLVSDSEEVSFASESEEEPLSKAKGKQAAKPRTKTKTMTLKELRELRKEERRQARARRNGTASEEAAMRKQLGRKLTYVSGSIYQTSFHTYSFAYVGGEVHHSSAQIPPRARGRLGRSRTRHPSRCTS